MGRKILETGQPAVPGSGDTIHDGGNKLRDNNEEIYNAFGDRRLADTPKSGDEVWIRPHATGYFQHNTLGFYSSAVEAGSMHDINSLLSAGHFPVRLPNIGQSAGQARRGERVVLQDSNDSWGTVPVWVQPASGQSITGADANGNAALQESGKRAIFTVVNDILGYERWDYRVENIAGTEGANIDITTTIPANSTARVDLFGVTDYSAIKVMLFAKSTANSNGTVSHRSSGEMMLMHNGVDSAQGALSAVLNTTTGYTIFTATPVVYTNAGGQKIVALDFTTPEGTDHSVTITLKTVSSVRPTL